MIAEVVSTTNIYHFNDTVDKESNLVVDYGRGSIY